MMFILETLQYKRNHLFMCNHDDQNARAVSPCMFDGLRVGVYLRIDWSLYAVWIENWVSVDVCSAHFCHLNDFCHSSQLEREPRTVIHVKRAKMFDPMGWFEVPSVSRKWIAGRFGVGLSPQNHPLKSAKNRGKKLVFIYVKRAKAKNNVISYPGVPRVRSDQCKQF